MISGLLALISLSVWIGIFHRIVACSFSTTVSGLLLLLLLLLLLYYCIIIVVVVVFLLRALALIPIYLRERVITDDQRPLRLRLLSLEL